MEDNVNSIMRGKLIEVARHANKFKVAHINAQSLHNSNHFSEFWDSFSNSEMDVIGVSETFFKNSSKMDIPNYNVFNVNRIESGGGGVAVYVHSRLKAKLLAKSSGEILRPEFLILEVKCASESILVSCVYRPPKVGYLETFLDELYKVLPLYKYSILCGDINARFGSGSFETKLISEFFELCNHVSIPFNATFKQGNCESILDVIASNCNDLVVDYGQCVAPGFSAHDLIYTVFDFKVTSVKKKTITFRDFKNIDKEAVIDDAKNVPWNQIYDCDTCDKKVQLLNDFLLQLLDKHAPIRTVKVKNDNPPWMSNELRVMIDERDKTRVKSLRTKDPKDCELHKNLKNKTKQQIRNAKIRYYHQIFNANQSPSKIWANIRKMGIGKAKQNKINDFPISANELNCHYLNVSKVEDPEQAAAAEQFYSEDKGNIDPDNLFYFHFVPAQDICRIIRGFKSNAVGVDGVSVRFIKLFLDEIAFVLEHIFNYCLQSSVFPSLWKWANVLPLPKVSNPSKCADFRPVSILCLFAKVLEKIVHDQIYDYATRNGLMNPLQSGYRKGHSTMTALLKVADDMRKSIDHRKLTLLVLLDLSKAFDRVNHKLLLIKLEKLGFSVSVIRWLEHYLSNRWQRVLSGDFQSDWALIKTGVPQGSVLGPLLFILYLYDISDVLLNTSYHMYADDTQLYIDFTIDKLAEAVALMNSDLSSLVKYISSHNLYLNVAKTQPIIVGSGPYVNMLNDMDVPQIVISNISVPYKEEVNNLGVIFDATLSWRQHAISVVKKVFSTFAQIKRNFDCLPPVIRLRLVQSLIIPHLDYGSVLFTDMNKYTTAKLQKAENACIRFISGASIYEHITPHYRNLGLLKLDDRRTISLATMIWKILKAESPQYLFNMFAFSTRHPERLVIPVHRTAKFANSFCVCATRVFNMFSGHKFLHQNNVTSFKKYLKSDLFKSY